MLFLEQTRGFEGSSAPSLFELIMQERMGASYKPAIEYLLHTLCESYPNLALALPVRYLDESYALLRLCFERYFLSKYDALATEKFYGMKRALNVVASDGSTETPMSPLPHRTKKLALFFAVVMPYIKSKLDAHYKVMAERHTRSSSQQNETENLMRQLRSLQYLSVFRKIFVTTYPFVHFVYEGSFFLYQWLYLFGETPYFSPFLRFMKTVLVRITVDDENMRQQNEVMYRKVLMEKMSGPSFLNRIRRLTFRTSWTLLDHSYMLLFLGIAGYKFLEWMYSEEGVAAKVRLTGNNAPIPPPPLPPQFSGPSLSLATMDPVLCPLCKKKRVNAAMTSSGYLFCYPCIYRHLERVGTCPVTHMKCEPSAIVKIYDDGRHV